jgi:prepilin-type processing-associated H-X9-DG protein
MWGGMAARTPQSTATILSGVGMVKQKDFTSDISLDEGNWPTSVDRSKALGTGGGNTLYKLREGIERFLITDVNNAGNVSQAQSSVPVMWDTFGNPTSSASTAGGAVFNHIPGGCNVLYMDGHSSFAKFPGAFPVVMDDGILLENSHFGLY